MRSTSPASLTATSLPAQRSAGRGRSGRSPGCARSRRRCVRTSAGGAPNSRAAPAAKRGDVDLRGRRPRAHSSTRCTAWPSRRRRAVGRPAGGAAGAAIGDAAATVDRPAPSIGSTRSGGASRSTGCRRRARPRRAATAPRASMRCHHDAPRARGDGSVALKTRRSPRPRHRDVKAVELLAPALAWISRSRTAPQRRRAARLRIDEGAALRVARLDRPVDQQRCGLGGRRLRVGIDHEHDARFQPLGAVHGQQLHGPGCAGAATCSARRLSARTKL